MNAHYALCAGLRPFFDVYSCTYSQMTCIGIAAKFTYERGYEHARPCMFMNMALHTFICQLESLA